MSFVLYLLYAFKITTKYTEIISLWVEPIFFVFFALCYFVFFVVNNWVKKQFIYLAPNFLFMRYMKWIGFSAALLLVASCFVPWVFIESKNIMVSGVYATGTNFGKPGYFHFLLTALFMICTLVPRVWAKRLNLLFAGLNLGWALKNFFMLAACSGGECPVRKSGLWLMLLASVIMLLSALFPDMKLQEEKTK